MPELYLCSAGDDDPEALDLLDQSRYWSTFGGDQQQVDLAGGILNLPIRILPPVGANLNLLMRKLLTDAPQGSGPWALGLSNVVLKVMLRGESRYTYIDVFGARTDPELIYYQGGFVDAILPLIVSKYRRGEPVTYSGLTMPAGGGAVWLPDIPGDVPGPAHIVVTDVSTGTHRIVSLTFGQHAGSRLTEADTTPLLLAVPQTPAVAHVNAGAFDGTEARLATVNGAWQPVARFTLPNTGRHNRRARIRPKVRAAGAVIGQPANLTATPSAGAGSLGTATIVACVVPYDGSPPYNGSQHLGTPSALITTDLVLLVAGGTQQMALTPLFYDDFELNTLERWFPGPLIYTNVTTTLGASGSGGSASVTTGATFKDTGTYGGQLTAVSPNDAASQFHSSIAVLAQATNSAKPLLSSHCRIKVQAETNNTSASALRGLAHWGKFTVGANPQLVGLATLDGTNWGLYFTGVPLGDGFWPLANGYTLYGPTFTLAAGFHDSEITIDITNLPYINVRLTVDGVVKAGGAFPATTTATLITAFGCTAVATSPANTIQATETLYIDTFSISDGYLGSGASVSGYALIYDWDNGPNVGGSLLKYLANGGAWASFDVGAVETYTLTSLLPAGVTLNSPPPTKLPPIVPTQIRVLSGLVGSAHSQPGEPVLCSGAGAYEWLDAGPLTVPPLPARRNQGALPAFIELQALNPGGDIVDCDALLYLDDQQSKATVERLGLTATGLSEQGTIDFDTINDEQAGCYVTNAADAVVEMASVSSPLLLGPGPTQLVAVPSVSDGAGGKVADAVNAQADIEVTITPYHLISQGDA